MLVPVRVSINTMIWPSDTCSKQEDRSQESGVRIRTGALAGLAVCLPMLAGSVGGKIELRDSKESVVSKKMDYSGVAVWLETIAVGVSTPALPAHAVMAQKDKAFSPHLLTVRTGTVVDFPNFDPIFHNAFSNYDGKVFDVGLYPPGSSRSVTFTRPGAVRVFCNIHAAMSAVIVVLNTPYFTTTRKNGVFELANVPPGEYWLRVFHERSTQATLDGAARRIMIASEPMAVPSIPLSESGYLAIPHKNKFGHEYSGEPDDAAYPAVRK